MNIHFTTSSCRSSKENRPTGLPMVTPAAHTGDETSEGADSSLSKELCGFLPNTWDRARHVVNPEVLVGSFECTLKSPVASVKHGCLHGSPRHADLTGLGCDLAEGFLKLHRGSQCSGNVENCSPKHNLRTSSASV